MGFSRMHVYTFRRDLFACYKTNAHVQLNGTSISLLILIHPHSNPQLPNIRLSRNNLVFI